MSEPTTIIAVVGLVLGAKTMIDGIKEGNILKAVAGGVAAFFGGSTLVASSTTSTAATGLGNTTMEAGTLGNAGTSAMSADLAVQGGAGSYGFNAAAAPATGLGSTSNIASTMANVGGIPSGAGSLLDAGGAVGGVNDIAGTVGSEAGTIGTAGTNTDIPDLADTGAKQSQFTTTKTPNTGLTMEGQAGGGGNVNMADNGGTMTNQMQSQSPTQMQSQSAPTNLLDDLKSGAGNAVEWAKENPLLAQQMMGSGMQAFGGAMQSQTAEEIAEDRIKWEEEKAMLASTPGNIYFDHMGNTRSV